MESGTYDYSGKGSTITLGNGSSYNFVIDGQNLRLIFEDEPYIADDGITYYFGRN